MLVDPRLHAALRNGTPLTVLVEIDHPDHFARFWTGIGSLQYEGETYLGAGAVGAIEVTERSTELRIDEVRLTLAGLDSAFTADLSDNIRNRLAWLRLAALDDWGRVIGTPMLLEEIQLDYQVDRIGEDGLATLQLVGQAGFWTLEQTAARVWSREDAALTWGAGNETGFDYITELRGLDTKWGQDPPDD